MKERMDAWINYCINEITNKMNELECSKVDACLEKWIDEQWISKKWIDEKWISKK